MKHVIVGVLAVISMAINRIPAKVIVITAPPPVDMISGKGWSYGVDFTIKNKAQVGPLISCESRGVNISRMDSNGLFSDGILQYNRASSTPNVIGSGTWAWLSKLSGIKGSPINPSDAIRMTDWAVSHGYGYLWTCWTIQYLSFQRVPSSGK